VALWHRSWFESLTMSGGEVVLERASFEPDGMVWR
jgi:hypothetical protein